MPLLSTLSKKPLSSLGRILFQSLGIVYRGLIDNPNSGGLSSVLDRFGQDTAVYGKYAFIGAGAVVTKEVPDYALMVGNPSKNIGWMSEFGERLNFDSLGIAICDNTGLKYKLSNNLVHKIDE